VPCPLSTSSAHQRTSSAHHLRTASLHLPRMRYRDMVRTHERSRLGSSSPRYSTFCNAEIRNTRRRGWPLQGPAPGCAHAGNQARIRPIRLRRHDRFIRGRRPAAGSHRGRQLDGGARPAGHPGLDAHGLRRSRAVHAGRRGTLQGDAARRRRGAVSARVPARRRRWLSGAGAERRRTYGRRARHDTPMGPRPRPGRRHRPLRQPAQELRRERPQRAQRGLGESQAE
jgi:hypothetical protein